MTSSARRCYNETIIIAFKGGYFGAIINIALAVFGVSILFLILYFYFWMNSSSEAQLMINIEQIPLLMIGYGLGASFVAMFA